MLKNKYYILQIREGFKKKVWNFPYLSGVGGFEKVIFHKKYNKHGLKMPKYSFKSNLLFFNMGGGLILRIFLTSKWLLDLPDLEILDFFNGKK